MSDFPKLSVEQRSLLDRATETYHKALPNSPALDYLVGRGITESVADTFRLGYVDSPEKGHEHVQGRLAIPFVSPSGVVDIRFRSLGDEEPKYLGTIGSTTHLFNVQSLHEIGHGEIAICEGELDCVVLQGMCDIPAVAISGVNNWKRHFKYLFSDFDRTYIVMDGDEPGRKAAEKIRKDLDSGVPIRLHDGDVNECYLAKGREYLRELMGL